MLRSARLTLKHHRFEVGAAALAATATGLAALWVNSRLLAIDLPASCLAALQRGADPDPECSRQIQEFGRINGEGAGKVFAAMAVLPFLTGLLGGVPLVGRELEARTAQMAWALAGSRSRWLGRQLWPVVLVLGVAIAFAAFSASVLETTRAVFPSLPLSDLGLHGPLAITRSFAAFGLGLLTGAILGRTLPAFIVGAALSMVLLLGAALTHQAWIHAQPYILIEQAALEDPNFDGIPVEQVWRAPDGAVLAQAEATSRALTAGASDPFSWLVENDYEVLQLGITAATAQSWEPVETGGFVMVGFMLVLATVPVIERRRPI